MESRRRRQLQRMLLGLAGLLMIALIGTLGAHHGSTTAATGVIAGAVAVCLLAAALVPSDAPRLRPPEPGTGSGSTAGLHSRMPGYVGGLGIHGQSDPRVRAIAERNGWTYRRSDPALTDPLIRTPLARGDGEYDVISGTADGVEFTAFSYGVRIGPGRPPVYRVVAIRLPAQMPPIAVGPERLLGSLGATLGLPDIDIESETFNRKFGVLCADRRYAVTLLTPRTVESMLGTESFCWRIDGDLLLSWDESLADPERLPDRIRQIAAIVHYAPDFVWQEYATS
jgi:hypothetical protein